MSPRPGRAGGHGTGKRAGARCGLDEPRNRYEREREREYRYHLPATASFQHTLPEPHADADADADSDAETDKVADADAISHCLFDLADAYREPEHRPQQHPGITHAVNLDVNISLNDSLSLNVDLAGCVALRIILRGVGLTIGFFAVVPAPRLCHPPRFAGCPPRREPQSQH